MVFGQFEKIILGYNLLHSPPTHFFSSTNAVFSEYRILFAIVTNSHIYLISQTATTKVIAKQQTLQCTNSQTHTHTFLYLLQYNKANNNKNNNDGNIKHSNIERTTAVGNGPCGASCVIFLWNVLLLIS